MNSICMEFHSLRLDVLDHLKDNGMVDSMECVWAGICADIMRQSQNFVYDITKATKG